MRAAALTCFVGHGVAELCGPGSDALLDGLGAQLRGWAAVLHERGVAALLEAVTTGTGLPRRLLATTDGERRLTDLRHVAQALHAAAVESHLGPAALVDWLRHRIADAAQDVGAERSRRLESDAAAVQIVTIHRSKGSEFPIVYVPFGWDRNVRDPEVPLLHDEHGARVLDVGGSTGGGWKERCTRHRAEEAGEDLRLLYVALTRACCQVVAWWVPSTTTSASPLHRLLFGRPAPGTEPPESCRVPSDPAALDALRALASPDLVVEAVESVTERPPPGPARASSPRRRSPARWTAAVFGRRVDTAWRRTSYSALTAGTHGGPGVGSEPEDRGTDDEATRRRLAGAGGRGAGAGGRRVADGGPARRHRVRHARPRRPGGRRPHRTRSPRRAHRPRRRAARAGTRRPGSTPDTLAAGARPGRAHPARPARRRPAAGRPRPAQTGWPSWTSSFPSRAATRPGTAARPRRAGPAAAPAPPAAARRWPATPTCWRRPRSLRNPCAGTSPAASTRCCGCPSAHGTASSIVDYKTNWLGPIGPDGPEPLTAAHYAPPLLAEAMIAAQYPLQALLYAVALHRFLRWRLPGYDPERNLGGVGYLFLRGMCGPDTPVVDGVPCGVFGWTPPAALVVELSRLLDGAS